MIWALVPAQPLGEGKSRLASTLSSDARERLNERFFRHSLETAVCVVGASRTLAISRSDALLDLARSLGARAVPEAAPHGLNEALEQAAALARLAGARAVLSLSCDLPFLEPDDTRALIAAVEAGDGVAIASNRAGTGTNALLVSPVGAIPYSYGPDSFARHCEAASRSGLRIVSVRRPGLAFDVDTPEDLEQWQAIERWQLRASTAP